MPESSLPPRPPTTNNNGLFIGGALVALLAAGGIFLALNGSKDEEKAPSPPPPAVVSTMVRAPAPPPPPPPPPPAETTAPAASTGVVQAKPASAAGGPATPAENRGPSGCSGACTGNADASLRNALRLRGASARGCYNKALRSNPTLQGKMTIAVRVSPAGTACSASVASDSLGDASVSSCILQQFRSGSYPKPNGGCVDVQVPLNFVPGGD